MSIRRDKPREYFAKLLNIPEEKIDYSEIPATSRADWEDAEVLLPVSAEEFKAIQEFIVNRRQRKVSTARLPK
jgi:hypothetical protein